jgi:hypothetical protein
MMEINKQQHQPLESPAITALSYDIKEEKEKLDKLYDASGGTSTDQIKSLETSIIALVAERKELRLTLTTQSTQGKLTYCQHILSPYRYVTTSTSFPNSDVVSLSKCVLSVELALFEGSPITIIYEML